MQIALLSDECKNLWESSTQTDADRCFALTLIVPRAYEPTTNPGKLSALGEALGATGHIPV